MIASSRIEIAGSRVDRVKKIIKTITRYENESIIGKWKSA